MRNRRASAGVAWIVVVLGVGAASGCNPFSKKSSGPAAVGPSCSADSPCPQGDLCVSGVCTPPGTSMTGDTCTASYQCAAGLYCSAFGTCAVAGTLAAGSDCTSDAVCLPPLRCNFSGFFGMCSTAGMTGSGQACTASTDCLAGLLCGASKTCLPPAQAFPPYAGTTCADDGAFRVYFEVPRTNAPPQDFFRLPFPNDIRVTGGALDMSDFPKPGPTPLGVDLVQLYVDAWTTDFDGFSSIGVTTFRFSGDIDFNTSTADNVWLVDVTPGANGRQYSRDWLFSPDRTKYSCQHRMTVRNTTDSPLLPKHTYAVILTTGLKSKTGDTPVLDPDMAAMLSTTAPADTTLTHAWTVYQPLRDWLANPGAGTTAPSVAAAAVFTVQDAPGHVQRLAASVATQPAPVLKKLTLCAAGVTSPCDDGTPARACSAAPDPAFDEIHGRFSVPIYQAGTEPYDTPDRGGGIVELAGVPQLVRNEDVCFALTVPKGAAPAAGWPLMVYHHGTGGSFRSFIDEGLAAKMAMPAGLVPPSAAFSFDAVEHGARRGASTKSPNDLVFNPLNPRASRDNLLQGAVDILQAFRVAGLTLDAATSPTGAAVAFDTTRVTYFGHSQGSTSGALAVAFSDAAPAAVFSGDGSFLTHSLLDKTNPVDIAAGLTFLLGEPLDDQHPVLMLFQSYFDRSDPLNYNPLIITRPPATLASKHVWMSEGTSDTYTPRSTLDATVASLGLPRQAGDTSASPPPSTGPRPVSLNVTGGDGVKRTAGVFSYVPDPSYDGHFVALMNPAAITDWSAFLGSFLATGTPVVP